MLAPSQMKLETVRDPTTKSHSSVKGSSLSRSRGLKVPSGSQTQIRSVSTSRQTALDRRAVALPRLEHLAGPGGRDLLGRPVRGVVVDHQDVVDDGQRLEARMVAAMLSRSL